MAISTWLLLVGLVGLAWYQDRRLLEAARKAPYKQNTGILEVGQKFGEAVSSCGQYLEQPQLGPEARLATGYCDVVAERSETLQAFRV